MLAAPIRAQAGAAATLAERYSPVLVVQPQTKPCGAGEPYRPTVVDLVLGNPEVVLRDSQGVVVKRAPAAQDLAKAPASDYIDLPGNPLSPGCVYEKEFQRWFGDRRPSVYARVATDAEHPGRLAVEYWLYYTFNDFTNKHESDWESMQVDFDAATPAQALTRGPYEVDLAQHAGGERGAWNDDPKLSRDGTHPVSFVATGSHADYFQRELYLGKGGTSIFGCDDTRSATERISPQTVLLPSTPVPDDSAFAWLDFAGRWGQREPGINNGPLGPVDHEEWEHPISWADGLRSSSLTVPGGRVLGLSATSFFCSAVSFVATTMNFGFVHPAPLFALLGIVVLAAVGAAGWTSWRPPDPRPLRRVRGGGQILRAARRVYWENLWTFVGIGVIFIPVSVLTGAIQWVLFHLTGVDRFLALDGRRGAGTVGMALFVGDIGAAFSAAAVTAAVAAALGELNAGRHVSAARAYTLLRRNARALAGATTLQVVITLLLFLTVIGIPLAVYRYTRTSLYAQTCVLEDRGALSSLRSSARLTRRRWWRTFAFTAVVDAVAVLSGPLLGVLILLITAQSLTFIDITSSLAYALTIPYAAIALTLYYFDLEARPAARRLRPFHRGRLQASSGR